MTTAIYAGTFDPITNGHIDIATRAASLFTRLIVALYDRPLKDLLFTTSERLAMTQEALKELDNVEVRSYSGLTVALAKREDARVLVRGLRVLSDFELEFQMALTNRSLAPEIDTLCLITGQDYSFLSSSIAKEIAMVGGCVDKMVPAHVAAALKEKFHRLGANAGDKVRIVSLRD
ncbi:MAG TPA: pantetheine-phosphate adenylyltransferase [Anaerolineae bacterium]|nr:pantetheine-phosphate adenylyltransferase [Anaerolineae bacterium]